MTRFRNRSASVAHLEVSVCQSTLSFLVSTTPGGAQWSGGRWLSARCAKGGFWLTAEEFEEAKRLLTAARSDLRAAELLAGDAAQGNDVVGFHVQQAVEKSIKAVLASLGVEIPYTHDVSFLLDIVTDHGADVPESVASAEWLTPWAAAMRYGAGDDVALDRRAAVGVARDALRWAAVIVDPGPGRAGS